MPSPIEDFSVMMRVRLLRILQIHPNHGSYKKALKELRACFSSAMAEDPTSTELSYMTSGEKEFRKTVSVF